MPPLDGGSLPPALELLVQTVVLATGDGDVGNYRRFRFTLEDGTTGFGYHPAGYIPSLACKDINDQAMDDWLIIESVKPFISFYPSAGANGTDVASAYRFTQTAPPSRPVDQACPGDLTRDGTTNGADLGTLLASWGSVATCPGGSPLMPADIDGSGVVDGADLGALLAGWGTCSVTDTPDPTGALGVIALDQWVVAAPAGGTYEVVTYAIPDVLADVLLTDDLPCLIPFDGGDGVAASLKCTICTKVVNYLVKKASWKAQLGLCPTFGTGAPICVAAIAVIEWGIKKWGTPWVCGQLKFCP